LIILIILLLLFLRGVFWIDKGWAIRIGVFVLASTKVEILVLVNID